MTVNLTLFQNYKGLRNEFSQANFSTFHTGVALTRNGMLLASNTI